MKFGICNEIFDQWKDIQRTIDYVSKIGYDGLEIAPFTLAKKVTGIPANTRAEIVRTAASAGLEIIGLHWLLVGPEGVYLNHPDTAIRERTAQYLVDLAHFCGDIGGKIMVFGSPKQRDVVDGLTYAQAEDYAVAVFEAALPTCQARGVTLCIEPLSTAETNFCRNAAEAMRLVERVNHPNFRLLLDTKAMAAEPEGRVGTIKKYAGFMKHYHANDENLEGPGFGSVDFAPIFQALKDVRYDGYVSVEVFKFDPGPEVIATRSLEYMKRFV